MHDDIAISTYITFFSTIFNLPFSRIVAWPSTGPWRAPSVQARPSRTDKCWTGLRLRWTKPWSCRCGKYVDNVDDKKKKNYRPYTNCARTTAAIRKRLTAAVVGVGRPDRVGRSKRIRSTITRSATITWCTTMTSTNTHAAVTGCNPKKKMTSHPLVGEINLLMKWMFGRWTSSIGCYMIHHL